MGSKKIAMFAVCLLCAAGLLFAFGRGREATAPVAGGTDPRTRPENWEEKYGSLVNVDYDAILAALPPLTDEEQKKVIQMGFRDCDHMVAAPIGEAAGIYKNLGLNVQVTKTGRVYELMAAGQMDAAYMGFGSGQVRAIENGAPFCIAAGNHTGGSYYLVVRSDLNTAEELIGAKLAIGSGAEGSTSWHEMAHALGVPVGVANYEVFDMKDVDEYFALKAGHLDGFICCDPWGSYAEYEGVGRIMATSWGSVTSETSGENAGIHCVLGANTDFLSDYPNLAVRVMVAHVLSLQYMYQHPYKAGQIFAEYFDVPDVVGLRTVWVKTNVEGRTNNWELEQANFRVWLHEYERWGIVGDDRPDVDLNDLGKIWRRETMDRAMEHLPEFGDFIREKVDPVFPMGMSFEEFLAVAREIDGVTD